MPPTLFTEGSERGNRLEWVPPAANPGAPIAWYNVYRYNNTREEHLATLPADQTGYLDTDVLPQHVYTYFVTSESSEGRESVPSNLGTAYPHCFEAIGPQGDIRWDCFIPLPGGPLGVILH